MGRSSRIAKDTTLRMAIYLLQQCIPTDDEPTICWRESMGGTMHLRYTGVTEGRVWHADLYYGHFYRMQIGSISEVCRSLDSFIYTLRRFLNV